MYDLLKIRQLVLNQEKESEYILKKVIQNTNQNMKDEQIVLLGKLEKYRHILPYLYDINKNIINVEKDNSLYHTTKTIKEDIYINTVKTKNYKEYLKENLLNYTNTYLIYTELDDIETVKFLKENMSSNINYVYYINDDYFNIEDCKNDICIELDLINISDTIFTDSDVIYYTNKITNRMNNIKLLKTSIESSSEMYSDILHRIYNNKDNIDLCINLSEKLYNDNKNNYRYFYIYISILLKNNKYDEILNTIYHSIFLDKIIFSELIYLKSKELFEYFRIVIDFYLNRYSLKYNYKFCGKYIDVLVYYSHKDLCSLRKLCKHIVNENIDNLSDSPFINMCYSNL